jgi:branched-subunit amino acid transport protein
MIWFAVIAGSICTYVAKLVGFLLPSQMLDRPGVRSITGLLPVALLAALVAVQTFAVGQTLAIDARLAGLVAAIAALLLRAPFLVVVLVAAVTAAVLRASGLAG